MASMSSASAPLSYQAPQAMASLDKDAPKSWQRAFLLTAHWPENGQVTTATKQLRGVMIFSMTHARVTFGGSVPKRDGEREPAACLWRLTCTPELAKAEREPQRSNVLKTKNKGAKEEDTTERRKLTSVITEARPYGSLGPKAEAGRESRVRLGLGVVVFGSRGERGGCFQ